MLNVSAKFVWDWMKDKKQHLFEYRLFSAIFDTQQSKDDVIDVIVTSFWILLVLPLRDFVPEYYHAKFGSNWTTNLEINVRGRELRSRAGWH